MSKQSIPFSKPETIVINNFSGRLTRILNGDLNSGFAKYFTSYGYNPFIKPMNLTWLRGPIDISSATPSNFTGLVVAGKSRIEGRDLYVYTVDDSGVISKFQPYARGSGGNPTFSGNSVVGTAQPVGSGQTQSYEAGASMEFFGNVQQIFLGTNTAVVRVNFDGSAASVVGSTSNYYAGGIGRPLKPFAGNLLFSNGNTFGAINATNTVVSSVIGTGLGNLYSQINPPFPPDNLVRDIDSSPDGNYAYILASTVPTDVTLTAAGDDSMYGALGESTLYKWNGVDAGTTALQQLPRGISTALQIYLDQQRIFSSDPFGADMNDGVNKLLTLPGIKSPAPNSISVNGNFITWATPEVSNAGDSMNASLFYFGSLDQENPSGLYRLARLSPTLASGFFYNVPFNLAVTSAYSNVYVNKTGVSPQSYGAHVLSTIELSSSTSQKKFWSFYVTPINNNVNANEGVYETQTQIWSKRMGLSQVRVYTEPVVTGNGFRLDLIDVDGGVMDNGTFTYAFGDPVDKEERINFSPQVRTFYGLGIRITNTGTKNMVIKKIEIDVMPEGQ